MGKRVRRLFIERPSRFVPKQRHTIINWGNSTVYDQRLAKLWNKPEAVAIASNKLRAFHHMWTANPAINLPPWCTSRQGAIEFIADRQKVVCRTKLNSHSGRGIVIATTEEELVEAGLYTAYIKKKAEYRVHVAFGKVIDLQQKRKRRDFDGDANPLVRNHANGWVYCRENIVAPADLETQGLLAVAALGLDFGAVDIIYNEHFNKCYVLEVNTAPGIEGTTVDKYAEAFMEKLNAP